MVNMETPKIRKLRRIKGSSKKKKNKNTDEIQEHSVEKHNDAQTSTLSRTPPQTWKSVIIERGQQEVRGVEWQYHGKFVESDIPIVWGSPHGSPVVNKVKAICESPGSRPKRKSFRIASKKFDSDESEPPQFLNEILALSEKMKAEEKNNQSLDNMDTGEKESAAFSKTGNNLEESFSKYFDEDGNAYLLQCSQELEETSSYGVELSIQNAPAAPANNREEDQENKRCVMESEISPRKKVSSDISSKTSLNKSSTAFHVKGTKMKSPRVGNKNYVHCKHKTNTYVFQGRVLGSKSSAKSLNLAHNNNEQVNSNVDQPKNKNSFVLKMQSAQKPEKTWKSNSPIDTSVDKSFEIIKESFLNDDLEFLSAIPDDLEIAPSVENISFCPKKPSEKLESKQQKCTELQNVSPVFENSTCFAKGMDTIESNVVPTQPLRCTPEEIERKRLVAKMKLEKKKTLLRK